MLRRVGVVDADEGDGLVGVLVVDHLSGEKSFLIDSSVLFSDNHGREALLCLTLFVCQLISNNI